MIEDDGLGMRMNRRDFMKIFSLSMGALYFPGLNDLSLQKDIRQRDFNSTSLPEEIEDIFVAFPHVSIDQYGYMMVDDPVTGETSQVYLSPTVWNQDNDRLHNRLYTHLPWAIVLHWFGERDDFPQAIDAYMRGFDTLRQVSDYETRTSAHFLIGDAVPVGGEEGEKFPGLGILQTQYPDVDGVPFVASHIGPMDYYAHQEGLQYFVKTAYQLNQQYGYPTSLLTEIFDGPVINPNQRSIAVEISGHRFDDLSRTLTTQKIANVLAVSQAIMKRYNIRAVDVLGHHEISL